jgi:hypothetical protein
MSALATRGRGARDHHRRPADRASDAVLASRSRRCWSSAHGTCVTAGVIITQCFHTSADLAPIGVLGTRVTVCYKT